MFPARPAPARYGINQSYQQSFNTLSNAAIGTTVPWVDNATLAGWYAAKGAPGSIPATTSFLTGATGSVSQAGTLYSLAQHFDTINNNMTISTWRALGAIPASSSQPAMVALRLKNSSGGMLSGLRVLWENKWGYTGTAVGSPTTGTNTLTLRYRKFSAGAGSLSGSPTDWTSVTST